MPAAFADPSPEQEIQYAATAVQRRHVAAERAREVEHPLKMQAAKDAYRADFLAHGGRRAIAIPGAMGITTTGMPSKMIAAVMAGSQGK